MLMRIEFQILSHQQISIFCNSAILNLESVGFIILQIFKLKLMKTFSMFLVCAVFIFSTSCNSGSGSGTDSKIQKDPKKEVTFKENAADKSIDVLINGKLFTTYRWPDNVTKPILYPIVTSEGTEITRGFPINPKTGERADHPHQIGNWFTYGDVDGNDFWGNGSHGLGTKNPNGGFIKHLKVDKMSDGAGEGVLVTSESWVDSSGRELMKEHTEYHFIAEDSVRIIDRITTLTANDNDVTMPDTKEGMFGIRVARQLELPDQGEITLYSASGEPEKVKAMDNESISGNYRSSTGETGLDVWGTRARWMDLFGNIGGEKISLVICDHPDNPSYPTWWHARGYGLFAANPLGAKDFTKDNEILNFKIPANKSVTFRYRIVLSSGFHLTDEEINAYADEFAKKY